MTQEFKQRRTRRSKLDAHRDEIVELLKLGVPQTRVAKRFGTHLQNLVYWRKSRGIGPGGEEVEG